MKKLIKPFALLALVFALSSAITGFTDYQAAQAPVGAFTINIKSEELPEDMPAGMRKALAGTWEIILLANNRFQLLLGERPMVEGRFTVADNEIVMTDEKGMISCATAPGEETGKYKWSLAADKLTFAPAADKCEGRKLILTLHTWTKKEESKAPKK
jgi:hypothetical protein